MYRQEYPRPNFVREKWQNLNGKWEFEICKTPELMLGKKLSKVIEVPFCPESILSGINNKNFMQHVWYRKNIEIYPEQLEGRVILHFGAVDYQCNVYINGVKIGEHIGGYVGFSFDITDFVKEGTNIIDVSVYDNTKSLEQPSGKQSMKPYSYACYYTRTTGIWQTVWLEFVSKNYIKKCLITPDSDSKKIRFVGEVNNTAKLNVDIKFDSKLIVSKEVNIERNFDIEIEINTDLMLWDTKNPNLYDIELKLIESDIVIDKVSTYCAFRKIELVGKSLLLNGKPIILKQVLDQGFYPDGIYTAKTVEEIYKDIDLGIEFGFNGARPHEKVFEPHYLYYADKKGYLIWGEYPNWGCVFKQKNGKAFENFVHEWKEVLARDYNHPSVIGWCPLNECWKFTTQDIDSQSQRAIYQLTKDFDSTRIVIGSSGGDLYVSDINDIHTYVSKAETIKEVIHKGYDYINPAVAIGFLRKGYPIKKNQRASMPLFLSEYGGMAISHSKDSWGYGKEYHTTQSVIEKYIELTNAIRETDAIGYCYTQLTDVEQEQNGLVNYDRTHKFSKQQIKQIRDCNNK